MSCQQTGPVDRRAPLTTLLRQWPGQFPVAQLHGHSWNTDGSTCKVNEFTALQLDHSMHSETLGEGLKEYLNPYMHKVFKIEQFENGNF